MAMPDLDLDMTEADLLVQSNPEALLDVLTIRSLRTRYVDNDVTSVASEPLISLERDLDTFVRDFQIDDSISDIFLMEDEPKKSKTKQTSGPNPADSNSKGSKKSNRRAQSVDNILETTDHGSTSSKKPKTFTSLFSRKNKTKVESRKAKAVTWHPQTSDVSKPSKSREDNSAGRKIDESEDGYMTMNKATNHTGSKPYPSFKDSRNYFPNKRQPIPDIDGEYAILHTACTDNTIFDELVTFIDNENTEALIHDLSTMPSDILCNLCDNRGNNILHKCVLKNKASLVTTTVSIHPSLASHVNKEEITPVELAVKLGRVVCLKTLLQKTTLPDTEDAVVYLSDLLTYAMQCRQDKVTAVILDSLASVSAAPSVCLPARGKRGPPSHVAAERDNITCLQRLVELGFDVTTSNAMTERPVNVAQTKGSDTSFRYLLLLHVLEGVLRETLTVTEKHRYAYSCERELKRERNMLSEKVGLLEKAKQQYETLMDKHNSSTRQCSDIVNNMLENKKNSTCRDELNQLKKLLSTMTLDSKGDRMSRHINDISNMLRSRTPPIPPPTEVVSAKANSITRKLLKDVHTSWSSPDFDVNELVKETLSSTTIHPAQEDRNFIGRNTSSEPVLIRVNAKEAAFSNSALVNVHQENNIVPEHLARHTTDTDCVQGVRNVFKHSEVIENNIQQDTHLKIQQRVSHEYEVIDKERENSERNGPGTTPQPRSCNEIRKTNLVHTKSPDYATISSDIGDNPSTGPKQIHEQTDLSDDDTMSTISSHNSTLQSAVGHLSQGCLSDTDSCSDNSDIDRQRRNVNRHFIGQFDVSDFSTDNSSDWWSASKCTSCFSQMTNSQMTSYYSEDEYENECYNYVRLNLENEDLPDELLRNHRLCRHLEAVQRLSTENKDVIETVVTASGERIGSLTPDRETRYINISGSDTGQGEQAEQRNKGREKKKSRVKLFNPCEMVSKRELSHSEFLECYDRSADVIHTNRCHDDLDIPWDQLQFSDVEEEALKDKPWYDVSEDEESLAHAWSSDSDASTVCNSSED